MITKKNSQHPQILCKIEADPNTFNMKSFANISRFSAYPDEKEEVLFMIGSIC